MQSQISDRFLELAQAPEGQIGLAEGALVLAREVRPELDIASQLEALAALVERARPDFSAAPNAIAGIDSLNRSLFERERFRGNQDEYDDPRNSFLDEVLARRRGLPITLSVLYVEVARRLGLDAHGIGFPGHFLAKIVDVPGAPEGEVIVDAFFGRVLSLDDVEKRLLAATGQSLALDPDWLRPATACEIYVRMLNNLKLLYLRQGDGLGALGCCDRILVLTPEAADEYRDRGLLLERLDLVNAAIEDYSEYLERAPRDSTTAQIRARRDALAQRRPTLN